jgi:hypothetical protein
MAGGPPNQQSTSLLIVQKGKTMPKTALQGWKRKATLTTCLNSAGCTGNMLANHCMREKGAFIVVTTNCIVLAIAKQLQFPLQNLEISFENTLPLNSNSSIPDGVVHKRKEALLHISTSTLNPKTMSAFTFDIIATISDMGNTIRAHGQLPWRLPEDTAFFQQITADVPSLETHINTVIMGHKTYESLPPRFRPLP